MKDEIKRKIKGYVYNEDDEKKILDYITNLQEENERLKNGYYTVKVGLEEIGILNELRDYKTRNEKAIELLKDIKYDLDIEPWSIYQVKGNILFDLLKILKGSDE